MFWSCLDYLYLALVGFASGLLLLISLTDRSMLRKLHWLAWADVLIVVGLCGFGTVLSFWSLWMPLAGWWPHILGLSVLVCGACAWFRFNLGRFGGHSRAAMLRRCLVVLAALPWLLSSLGGGLGEPGHYDTLLYHAQCVMWNEQFPAVPGLGNLHGRFACHSAFFGLTAFFGLKAQAGITLFGLNSFLMLLATIGCLARMVRSWRLGDISMTLMNGAFIVLCYGIGLFGQPIYAASPSPDVWAGTLVYYGCLLVIKGKEDEWRDFCLVSAALVAAFAITIKLSALPLAGLPVIMIVAKSWRCHREWLIATGVGVLVLLPWVVRNVIQSGYLAYPIEATRWPALDWTMAPEAAANERLWIAAAPLMSQGLATSVEAAQRLRAWDWFPIWMAHLPPAKMILISFVIASPLAMAGAGWQRPCVRRFLPASLISWAGAIFSLVSVPDPSLRFSFGFVFMAVALTLGGILSLLPERWHRQMGSFTCLAVIACCWLGWQPGQPRLYQAWSQVVEHPWLPDSRLRPLPMDLKPCVNFSVRVPAPTESHAGTAADWCGQEPLPCTPYYNEKLELRGTSLREGFRIHQEVPPP